MGKKRNKVGGISQVNKEIKKKKQANENRTNKKDSNSKIFKSNESMSAAKESVLDNSLEDETDNSVNNNDMDIEVGDSSKNKEVLPNNFDIVSNKSESINGENSNRNNYVNNNNKKKN